MNTIQTWVRLGIISSVAALAPSQSVFAFGSQWRPSGEMASPSRAAPAFQTRNVHSRFRPVSDAELAIANPSRGFMPMPPAPVAPPPPPQMPTFAKQYQWRPAAQPWAVARTLPQPSYPAAYGVMPMQQPVAAQWRQAPQFVPPAMPAPPMAPMPGAWRPVESYSEVRASEPSLASSGSIYRPMPAAVVEPEWRAPQLPTVPELPPLPSATMMPQAGYYAAVPTQYPMPSYPAQAYMPPMPAPMPLPLPMAQPMVPWGVAGVPGYLPAPMWMPPMPPAPVPFDPFAALAPGMAPGVAPQQAAVAGCPECAF